MTMPPDDDATTPTGEVPVVQSLENVPAEVLEELTQAFEVAIDHYEEAESATELVIGGHDLISDDELTHASRPPIVIEDSEFTAELERAARAPEPDRRWRLRRIAVQREAGRRRLRVFLYVAVPILGVALILGILASPLFGVRTIEVDGAKYSSKESVKEASDMLRGKSIFSADLHSAEERLRADPWIRDARASRHFPSTVVLEITERRPVAWFLGSDNQARIIDVEGRVIAVLNGQPTTYMQITGIGDVLTPGAQADEAYTAAAQIATSLPLEIKDVVLNVGVTNGTDVIMTLRSGTVVVFGRPTDLRAKLVALVLVLRRQTPQNLHSIDLSSGDPVIAVK